MKRLFYIAFAVLFAVCTACTQDGNNRDLVLVFNDEWSIPAIEYICSCSSFDAEISDIQFSKHWNTYKYTIRFKDALTKIEDGDLKAIKPYLTSVTIPNSVTEIGEYAFRGCSSLASFKGQYASKDGRSLIIDGELRFFAGAGLVKYKIPDSVTEIGEEAFYGCKSLTSVTIPNSVTKIGKEAFAYSSLTSVTIPDSVTKIGDSAFSWCKSLTSVTIPDSVTEIGDSAFYSCEALTSVTIPDSVTEIGDSAFYSCEALTSVTIPNSVKKIGDSAFGWCKSLTSVRLPRGVILASNSFYHETKLEYSNEYSNEYSHTGETVVFQNWQSVLPYLSSRVFRSEDGRSRVKIETRGVFLNGRQVADAPEIISVSETYAVIHAAIPPHSRYRFGVLPQEGCIVDLNDHSRYYCE